MGLETIFADTVARGWRPRSVAVGAEIERLEASLVRGTCIAPLAVDGDTLFIDPAGAPPLPGDLVSFALSERGAAAQNSALPPGQSPCRAGDRWAKLLTRYHNIDFLLDRFGSSATATLLSCESPDDVPALRPVRNVMRGGRLLYASGLGNNSATYVAETSVSSVSLTGTAATIVSQSVGPFVAAATVVVTCSGYLTSTYTAAGLTWPPEFAYAIYTSAATLPTGHPYFHPTPVPGSNTYGTNFTYEQSFTLAVGTSQTYYLNGACTDLVADASMAVAQMVLKCECILR